MKWLPVVLFGCTNWTPSGDDGVHRVLETSVRGTAMDLSFDVEPGEDAFLLTAMPDVARVYLSTLTGPGGTDLYTASDWWDADNRLTNAGFTARVANLSWPPRDVDVPLEPGRYRARIVFDSDAEGEVVVTFRRGSGDLPQRLPITVHVAQDVWDDPRFADNMDEFDDRVSELLEQVDLTADITWTSVSNPTCPGYNGSCVLVPGDDGSAQFFSEASGAGQLDVIIVSQVDYGAIPVLGIAGDVPGSREPSATGAVALDWVEALGAEGAMTTERIRLFSETLGHEVLHFTGLFHPVEFPDYDLWDALDDTPQLTSPAENDQILGTNLMYPYPVQSGDGFVPQDQLTDQQGWVARGWVGAVPQP